MMDEDQLAQEIWDSLDTHEEGVSDQTKSYARGIVKMMQAGIAVFPPGSVTSDPSLNGPVLGGKGKGGKITGLNPLMISAEVVPNWDPVASTNALPEHTAVATYIMGAALLEYARGAVTGESTATASSAGILTLGAAKDGRIKKLDGEAMANAVKLATGLTGPTQKATYTVICDYIMRDARVEFKTNTVTGVYSTAGTLEGGTAAGGVIR